MAELISYEPATGAVLWRGQSGDVDAEVAMARASWAAWASHPLTYRIEAMRRFANVVRGKHEAFADTIARETGKPLWEARTEVDSVIAKVDISVAAYAERTAQRRLDAPMGSRMALRHKPHGVLAVLGPYNFPAHLPNGHIVPALLAGNAVIFKPSEKTPATGVFLVECFHAAGIPEGVVRLLLGGPAEGKALAAHDDIDGLLFTGSASTGIALNRAFATRPEKILALEMGGNNPIIVWDTPDMLSAATLIVQSAFTSAGQRCTAARRLIVDTKLYDPLVATLLKLMGRIIVGGPHDDPQPFMGAVIDKRAFEKIGELGEKGDGALKRSISPDNVTSLFTGKKTAFLLSGPWQIPDVEKSGVPYEITPIPGFQGGKEARPFVGVQAMYVASQGRFKSLAQEFATNYFIQPEVAISLYKADRRPPPLKAAFEEVSKTDPDMAKILDAGKNGDIMPAIPEMATVWDPLGKAQSATVGGAAPGSTVAAAAKAIEGQIK